MIDAVVFDVGNVLIEFDPKHILTELFPGDEAQAVRGDIMRLLFMDPIWLAMDRGTIDMESVARQFAQRHPRLADPMDLLLNRWTDHIQPIAQSVLLLERLKKEGYKLYALTNFAAKPFEQVRKRYGFFELFEGCVVSAEERLLKPDLEIYRRLMERYGLSAERVLFVDDSVANVEAAMHLGMHALVFKNNTLPIEKLLGLGVDEGGQANDER